MASAAVNAKIPQIETFYNDDQNVSKELSFPELMYERIGFLA